MFKVDADTLCLTGENVNSLLWFPGQPCAYPSRSRRRESARTREMPRRLIVESDRRSGSEELRGVRLLRILLLRALMRKVSTSGGRSELAGAFTRGLDGPVLV